MLGNPAVMERVGLSRRTGAGFDPGAALQITLELAYGESAEITCMLGHHGLPLMGTGDWNDGMNLVVAGGKGESVWLAWSLVDVL